MNAVLKAVAPTPRDAGEEDRIIAEALAILEHRHAPGEALASPTDTKAYLRLRLADRRFEIFGVIYLDYNAAALIAFHNHPSGQPEPSRADEQLTQQLRDTLALLDIRVLDHLVVSAEGAVSMAERGLM